MPTSSRRWVLLASASVAASALSGCSDDGGGDDEAIDPAARGPIEIAELAFTAGRPDGLDDYERQPESTYEPDRPIWVYADFDGLAGEPVEDEDGDSGADGDETPVTIDLEQTVTVEAPDGSVVVDATNTYREELTIEQLDGYFTATEILLAGRAEAGEYPTTISVSDGISGTEATESATFRIEE